MAAWDERFEAVVRANAPFLPPDQPLEPAHSLFDLGLDSMGTVALLLELEEAFGVTFPDEGPHPGGLRQPGVAVGGDLRAGSQPPQW